MKKIILLTFVALMSLFGAQATPTIVPVTSTSGNETWYLIKCNPRNDADPNATWLSVTAQDSMTYTAYTGGDEQLWKVVANPNGLGGVALVNKKKGFYVDADNRRVDKLRTRITTKAGMPDTPLRLVPSTCADYKNFSWPGWDGKIPGVFILDNTTATSVDDNNKITVNSTEDAFALSIYAPSSGTFIVANQPGWVGNPNQVVLFRTPDEAIADTKALLQVAISNANNFSDSCSIGSNPGQYSAEDMSALKDAIEAAQDVYDDSNSSIGEYVKGTSDLNSILSSFGSYIILPKFSTDGNEHWYFFQGTRPANTYMTSTGSGANVLNKAIIPDNTQLWKIVANGDGYAFVNKATGEYINTDVASNTNLVTQTLLPTKALKFRVSPEITNKVARFYVENTGSTVDFRLHSGAANVMNWTGKETDNCSWLIMDYATLKREALKADIASADSVTITQKGNNPGQLNQAVIDEFKAVITEQQAVYDDPNRTSDEYEAASTALADARAALYTKANLPVISTDASSVWYTLSGTRPEVTSLVYTDSMDSLQYGVVAQNDSALWRFVANGTGFAIQNKVTMQYVVTDSEDGTRLATQSAMPTTPLKFVRTNQMSQGAYRISMVNDGATQPWGDDLTFNFHAEASSPMNYLDPTDNSGWIIADNVQRLKNTIAALIPTAETLYTKTAKMESASYGGYPAAVRASLKVEIDKVKSLDLNSLSYEQLNQAYNTFYAAYSALMNGRISDINMLVSTATQPKWFYWEGTSGNANNQRIASGSTGLSAVAKADNDPTQMWRFELNEDQSVRIINSSTQGEVEGLTTQLVATAAAGTGIPFNLGVHADGVSLKITYENSGNQWINCRNDKTLWGYGYSDGNSAWRFRAIDDNTAVKNTTVNKYLIRSINGVITIDGVSNFEVYSIMGQRINNKTSLRKGVYIVKIGNETQKYIVR